MAVLSYEVRKAIYDTLTGASALTSIVGSNIFQSVAPSNISEPYVAISTITKDLSGRSKDATDIVDVSVRIYGYSLDTNPTEIDNISQAIEDALDRQSLTVNNYVLVGCFMDGLDEIDLIDGSRHRCVKDFIVKTSI